MEILCLEIIRGHIELLSTFHYVFIGQIPLILFAAVPAGIAIIIGKQFIVQFEKLGIQFFGIGMIFQIGGIPISVIKRLFCCGSRG